MRSIFRDLHDCPADSGASNPPTFTPHSLTHPYFCVLYLWQQRSNVTCLPNTRNRFIFGLNYLH